MSTSKAWCRAAVRWCVCRLRAWAQYHYRRRRSSLQPQSFSRFTPMRVTGGFLLALPASFSVGLCGRQDECWLRLHKSAPTNPHSSLRVVVLIPCTTTRVSRVVAQSAGGASTATKTKTTTTTTATTTTTTKSKTTTTTVTTTREEDIVARDAVRRHPQQRRATADSVPRQPQVSAVCGSGRREEGGTTVMVTALRQAACLILPCVGPKAGALVGEEGEAVPLIGAPPPPRSTC